MEKCKKLLEKARASSANLTFEELRRLAECQGFQLARSKGSHQIFKSPESREIMNLQRAKNGKAKAFQVRQLLAWIDRNRDVEDGNDPG